MKFEINGVEFRELINRISGIVPKKSSLSLLEFIKISADDNTVTFQATDCENYGTIRVYANVYENGEAWVSLDDIKKAVGVNDNITVSSNLIKFEIRSLKKSYEISCEDFNDVWIEFPMLNKSEEMCVINDSDILSYLASLNCMRSSEGHNRMMSCFCMDLSNRKIVTLDGYRIGIANIFNGKFSENCKQLVANEMLYNGLKTLIGKVKNDSPVKIYADSKTICFVGNDWTYQTKIVEGKYFDYEKLISGCKYDYDYVYYFNNVEVGNIAKEYGKIVSAKNKAPMIFYNNNGSIATGIQVSNYKTSDIVESVEPEVGMEHEWYVGLNPTFISDACKVFNGNVKAIGKYNHKAPIMFSDDTYEMLILPVNVSSELSLSFVKKQVT